MAQPGRVIDSSKRFFRRPFGSALVGGLVVGILGWVAIAAGWIESGDQQSPISPLPPLSSVVEEGGNGLPVNDVYRRDSPAVAFVEAEKSPGQVSPALPIPQGGGTARGSGFLLDSDGHVVTNAHVVSGADRIDVTLGEGDSVEAKLVGQDRATDIALLEVDEDEVDAQPLSLGDSDQVRVGDPVVAIGNPFGLDRTVTTGIVSALQRQIEGPSGFTITDVIQHDASINPGNSGGPLIDAQGRVIGINSQIATAGGGGSVGVGFAVPVNTVSDVASQLLETGEVEHPFLGINGADVTPQIADALNLPVDRGALVQHVEPGSPADEEGMKGGRTEVSVGGAPLLAGGHIITAVDGNEVSGMDEVISAINSKQPGDELQLTILRGEDQSEITATLTERPAGAG